MDTTIPWGLVIFSFTLWFLLKPLLDPRSYIKIGTTFALTILIILLTSNIGTPDCVTLAVHLLAWTIVYTLIFWPTHPATSLYKNENPLVGAILFLTSAWYIVVARGYLSKTGILGYSVTSAFLWKTGGNYMSNRPKSVGSGVLCSIYLSNSYITGMTLPFIWFSLMVYCNVERCISIVDTWPKLCPGKSFVTDVIFSLFQLQDEDLPQNEVADIRDMFSILNNPKTLKQGFGSLIMLNLPQASRIIVAPIALLMKRLDDMTEDETLYTKEEALRQLQEARLFFDEVFQGRVKDWDFGLWPRPQGSPTQNPVNVERYINSIPSVEPSILRVVIATAEYIPPKVAYDILDSFVWERTNGMVNTEEDLLWWCTRTATPVGHMVVSAVMSRYYLDRRFIQDEFHERYMEVMKLLSWAGQYCDVAMDIPEDSGEGKVLIPSDWIQNESHYDVLKFQKDPWALGKETLQRYAHKLFERAGCYADEAAALVDQELQQIFPTVLQRCLVHGPTFLKMITEINKDRIQYTRNILEGHYMSVILNVFVGYLFPMKTPNGWLFL